MACEAKGLLYPLKCLPQNSGKEPLLVFANFSPEKLTQEPGPRFTQICVHHQGPVKMVQEGPERGVARFTKKKFDFPFPLHPRTTQNCV